MMQSVVGILALIAISLVMQICFCSHINIDVTTQYHHGVIPNAFNIRCTPQVPGNCAKTVISIQVSKGSDKTVATLQRDDSISYDRLLESSVKAEGHIDNDHTKTFLSVTINDAVKEDSGLYSCKLLYMDETLQFKFVTASTNVSITNQDTQDIIKHLMSKISFLENLVQFHQNEMSNVKTTLVDHAIKIDQTKSTILENVLELQNTTRIQTQRLDDVITKENTVVSFMALHSRIGVFQEGNDMIYSEVISNEGGCYDGTTGVFTVPVTGYYQFQVSVAAYTAKHIYLDLRTSKGQVLTRLLAYDPHTVGYSDTSCMVKLESGEMVKPVIREVGPGFSMYHKNTQDYMNKFNGYLLKIL